MFVLSMRVSVNLELVSSLIFMVESINYEFLFKLVWRLLPTEIKTIPGFAITPAYTSVRTEV